MSAELIQIRLDILKICFRLDMTPAQNIERAREIENYVNEMKVSLTSVEMVSPPVVEEPTRRKPGRQIPSRGNLEELLGQ